MWLLPNNGINRTRFNVAFFCLCLRVMPGFRLLAIFHGGKICYLRGGGFAPRRLCRSAATHNTWEYRSEAGIRVVLTFDCDPYIT